MKLKTNRFVVLLLMIISVLFASCSCSSLKITEEMQKAIDQYLAAVEKTQKKSSGKIKVVSVMDDQAIDFKKSENVIDFEYEIKDGKVIYNRTDTVDGKESAKYKCDGKTVQSYNYDSSKWKNDTENNKDFLSSETNPLTTLSLFRVDNNLKLKKEYLSDIKSRQENGITVVEFTLKDSTVSDVLSFNKADGIVRQSAGHIRTYYIDEQGYIVKIVISTTQKFISNGKEGLYKTEMTVFCN